VKGWRASVANGWGVVDCLRNPDKIQTFLKQQPHGCRLQKLTVDDSAEHRKPTIAPVDFNGNVKGIKSFLKVETDVGRGRGVLTLCPDPVDGQWKAFILFTALQELKGHEEAVGDRRPAGVQHGGNPGRKNWSDRRVDEKNFEDGAEPTVFIIGKPGIPD
jgi:hypothetical protein